MIRPGWLRTQRLHASHVQHEQGHDPDPRGISGRSASRAATGLPDHLMTWAIANQLIKKHRFLLLFACVVLCFIVYFYTCYRITSINAWVEVLKILLSRESDERCVFHNHTHYRCMPNVLFIGASKCGTTSVTDYLDQHPKIQFTQRRIVKQDHHREVHRFDAEMYGWTLNWLNRIVEFASSPILADPSVPLIHYTPHYIYAPTVPFEVPSLYPNRAQNMKFIVMLREPVSRAFSAYWFQYSKLFQEKDRGSLSEFQEKVMEDIATREVYEQCIETHSSAQSGNVRRNSDKKGRESVEPFSFRGTKIPLNSTSGTSGRKNGIVTRSIVDSRTTYTVNYDIMKQCFGSRLRHRSLGSRYVDKGIYVDQLLRWFSVYPRDHFYISTLERWEKDPQHEYDALMAFLESPHGQLSTSTNHKSPPSTVSPAANVSQSGSYRKFQPDFTKRRLIKPNHLSSMEGSRSREEVALREYLKGFYKPYNEHLEHVLGIDLGWN